MPEQVSFDHDSVFYDNASASPYPTGLHLWLIALGISVRFIEQKPPVEHSVIERSHQTIEKQALDGQFFTDQLMLEKNLSDRREFLNASYLDNVTLVEIYGKIMIMEEKKKSKHGACPWQRLPSLEIGCQRFTNVLGSTFKPKRETPVSMV